MSKFSPTPPLGKKVSDEPSRFPFRRAPLNSARRNSYTRYCLFPQQIAIRCLALALAALARAPLERPSRRLLVGSPLDRGSRSFRYCARVQPPAPGGRNASAAGILATTVR